MTGTTAPPSTRDLSVLALGVTVTAWASAFVGIRAVADVFEPGPLSLGRLVVGALALTVIARPWRHRIPRGRTLGLVVVYGVVWFGAYNVTLNAGIARVDAGTSALIVNVAPLLIALFAGFVLKEGFPRPLVAGLVVAFAGVVVIGIGTRQDDSAQAAGTAGVLLCLAAAVFYAVGALSQKPTLTTVAPAMSVWMACTIGAVVCLPYAPALVDQLGDASASEIGWLVYLGVVPTAIGFAAWSYALQRLSAGQVASTTYLVPVIATAISWVLLQEVPAPLAFAGGALCLAGVALTRWRTGPKDLPLPRDV